MGVSMAMGVPPKMVGLQGKIHENPIEPHENGMMTGGFPYPWWHIFFGIYGGFMVVNDGQ